MDVCVYACVKSELPETCKKKLPANETFVFDLVATTQATLDVISFRFASVMHQRCIK